MATQNIISTSETKEWILACNAFEQCELESLRGNISFMESELIPTELTEIHNMTMQEFIPRNFSGDGVSSLWVYIDNKSKLRKRPILQTIKSNMQDGNGNAIGSLKGALNIHDADVHNTPVNTYFVNRTGTITTLAANSAAGAISITVTSAVGFTIGNHVELRDGVNEITFPRITNIVGSVLTLDRPLDNAFSIGDEVELVLTNMNVSGTLAGPVSFKIRPDADKVWHLVGFNVSIVHGSAADGSKFGDITDGITDGVVLRIYKGSTGTYRTFSNWKTNARIGLDAGNIIFSDKAGGGNFGTFAEALIKHKSGAVPIIDGTQGDYLEILIQDNLTTLVSFESKAQLHIEGE